MLILLLLTVIAVSAADDEKDQILQACRDNNVLQPCDAGWYRLDGNRCMKSTRILAIFDIAERYCTKEGGHLVSINNETDYNKVLCLLVSDLPKRNPYWIGAKRQQGQYQWTDGSGPLTFTKWAPGQPDNPPQDCVETNYGGWGQWNDQSCSEKRLIMCEKRG